MAGSPPTSPMQALDARVAIERYYDMVVGGRDKRHAGLSFDAYYLTQAKRIDPGTEFFETRIPGITRMDLMLVYFPKVAGRPVFNALTEHQKLDEKYRLLLDMGAWKHVHVPSPELKAYMQSVGCAGACAADVPACTYRMPSRAYAHDPLMNLWIARSLQNPDSVSDVQRCQVVEHASTHPESFAGLYVSESSRDFYRTSLESLLAKRLSQSEMPSQDGTWSAADIDNYVKMCEFAANGVSETEPGWVDVLANSSAQNPEGVREWIRSSEMHPSARNAATAMVYPRVRGSAYSFGQFKKDLKSAATKVYQKAAEKTNEIGARITFFAEEDLPKSREEADVRARVLKLYLRYGMQLTSVRVPGDTVSLDDLAWLDDTMVRVCRFRGSEAWKKFPIDESKTDIFRGETDTLMRAEIMVRLADLLRRVWLMALKTPDDAGVPDPVRAFARLQNPLAEDLEDTDFVGFNVEMIRDLNLFVRWICADMADRPEILGGPVDKKAPKSKRCTYKLFRERYIRDNTTARVSKLRDEMAEEEAEEAHAAEAAAALAGIDEMPRSSGHGLMNDTLVAVRHMRMSVERNMMHMLNGSKTRSIVSAHHNPVHGHPDQVVAMWLHDNSNRCARLNHVLFTRNDLEQLRVLFPTFLKSMIHARTNVLSHGAAARHLQGMFGAGGVDVMKRALAWLYLLAGCWSLTAYANYQTYFENEKARARLRRSPEALALAHSLVGTYGDINEAALDVWNRVADPIFEHVITELDRDPRGKNTPVLPSLIEEATLWYFASNGFVKVFEGSNPYELRELIDTVGRSFVSLHSTESVVHRDGPAARMLAVLYRKIRPGVTEIPEGSTPDSSTATRFIILHNALKSLAPRNDSDLTNLYQSDSILIDNLLNGGGSGAERENDPFGPGKHLVSSVVRNASQLTRSSPAVPASGGDGGGSSVQLGFDSVPLYRMKKADQITGVDRDRCSLNLPRILELDVLKRLYRYLSDNRPSVEAASYEIFSQLVYHMYPRYDNCSKDDYINLATKKHSRSDGYVLDPGSGAVILAPSDFVMTHVLALLDTHDRMRMFIGNHIFIRPKKQHHRMRTLYGLYVEVDQHKRHGTPVSDAVGRLSSGKLDVVCCDGFMPEGLLFVAIGRDGKLDDQYRRWPTRR